jgi:hypothetical protein
MVWVAEIIRNMFKGVSSPVQEITVVFLMTEVDEWIAYAHELPALNSSGGSAAEALAGLMSELKQYAAVSGFFFEVTSYTYLSHHLPS